MAYVKLCYGGGEPFPVRGSATATPAERKKPQIWVDLDSSHHITAALLLQFWGFFLVIGSELLLSLED